MFFRLKDKTLLQHKKQETGHKKNKSFSKEIKYLCGLIDQQL